MQHRRATNDFPKIPNDRIFNQIPDILRVTKRNNEFLQFDSGPGDDCIIIFSTLEQLQLLKNCEQLLVDGTFKVSLFLCLCRFS